MGPFAGGSVEFKKRFRYQELLLAPAAKSPGSLLDTGLDESEEGSEQHSLH